MKKLTQRDLVVLSLADHREWRRPYELEKRVVGHEMIGSEADTRLGELFGTLPSRGSTKRKIDGVVYVIETKKMGGERWYRAYVESEKPRQVVEFVEKDGQKMAHISYI